MKKNEKKQILVHNINYEIKKLPKEVFTIWQNPKTEFETLLSETIESFFGQKNINVVADNRLKKTIQVSTNHLLPILKQIELLCQLHYTDAALEYYTFYQKIIFKIR